MLGFGEQTGFLEHDRVRNNSIDVDGAILAVGGFLRWRSVQRAMRRGEPLPAASLVPVLAAGLLVVAVVAFVLVAAT